MLGGGLVIFRAGDGVCVLDHAKREGEKASSVDGRLEWTKAGTRLGRSVIRLGREGGCAKGGASKQECSVGVKSAEMTGRSACRGGERGAGPPGREKWTQEAGGRQVRDEFSASQSQKFGMC